MQAVGPASGLAIQPIVYRPVQPVERVRRREAADKAERSGRRAGGAKDPAAIDDSGRDLVERLLTGGAPQREAADFAERADALAAPPLLLLREVLSEAEAGYDAARAALAP